MAEKIKLRVKCHACGNIMEGSAKYGKGHYNPSGLEFEYIAVGKFKDSKGSVRVKGEVYINCPECTVRNKYEI